MVGWLDDTKYIAGIEKVTKYIVGVWGTDVSYLRHNIIYINLVTELPTNTTALIGGVLGALSLLLIAGIVLVIIIIIYYARRANQKKESADDL